MGRYSGFSISRSSNGLEFFPTVFISGSNFSSLNMLNLAVIHTGFLPFLETSFVRLAQAIFRTVFLKRHFYRYVPDFVVGFLKSFHRIALSNHYRLLLLNDICCLNPLICYINAITHGSTGCDLSRL